MSVVNKMLQDLEARQSHTDDINADYQPPQKKQSTLMLLVLLILAIAAIIFYLTDQTELFNESKNSKTLVTPDSPHLAAKIIQKMPTVSGNMPPQESVQEPMTAAEPINAEIKTLETETLVSKTNLAETNTDLKNQLILPQKIATSDKPASLQDTEIQNIQRDTAAITEQPSSFSMTGSSQENNSSSLKQRIAESLNNDNLGLAQSLLQQLLETESR